jgi:Zn-dependent peptidase ImmA (M78 family)
MTKNTDPSTVEFLMKEIAKVLAPVAEANRLLQELNVRSLEDTCHALEGAGYQIYRVDLPSPVRGFATVVEGQPHILTNRCDCCDQHRYTVSHELGHHVLHMNPSPAIAKLGLAEENEEDREFRANQFATTWFMGTATPEQRKRFLRKNPEMNSILVDSMMDVVFMILPFVLLFVFAHLFSKNSPA